MPVTCAGACRRCSRRRRCWGRWAFPSRSNARARTEKTAGPRRRFFFWQERRASATGLLRCGRSRIPMPAGPVSRPAPPVVAPSPDPAASLQPPCPAGSLCVRISPTEECAMKVLACDGIHEDGLALLRDAGWEVVVSDPIKDPAELARALGDVDVLLVRSAT